MTLPLLSLGQYWSHEYRKTEKELIKVEKNLAALNQELEIEEALDLTFTPDVNADAAQETVEKFEKFISLYKQEIDNSESELDLLQRRERLLGRARNFYENKGEQAEALESKMTTLQKKLDQACKQLQNQRVKAHKKAAMAKKGAVIGAYALLFVGAIAIDLLITWWLFSFIKNEQKKEGRGVDLRRRCFGGMCLARRLVRSRVLFIRPPFT